jgi:Ig-like domain from next to BRCA1 gene
LLIVLQSYLDKKGFIFSMLRSKRIIPISLILLAAVVLAACGPSTPPTPTIDANAVITQVAQTVEAGLAQTQAAIPSPTSTNTPQPTAIATLTPVVTSTPFTINTPTFSAPLPGTTSGPDKLKFVADVTVPDGTIFKPGEGFDKTWKIQNIGTSTWNKNYRFYYCAGIPNDLVKKVIPKVYINLDGDIAPQSNLEITMSLISPDANGHYRIYFQLLNASGLKVPDDQGNGCSLWVDFTVSDGVTP